MPTPFSHSISFHHPSFTKTNTDSTPGTKQNHRTPMDVFISTTEDEIRDFAKTLAELV